MVQHLPSISKGLVSIPALKINKYRPGDRRGMAWELRRAAGLPLPCPNPEVFALGCCWETSTGLVGGKAPSETQGPQKGLQRTPEGGLVMELDNDEAALGRFCTWLRQRTSQGP